MMTMRRTGSRKTGSGERGQVVVVFALGAMLFIGLCAVVIDVAWYWANNLRVQRAADSAALAGVVYLPGDEPGAATAARAEAVKNGYTNGVGGVTVTAAKDVNDPRSLRVTVSASVPTYFMRYFGISSIAARKTSQAEYVLPVPMGSPENYYGVFGKVRTPSGSTTVTTTTPYTSTPLLPTTSIPGTPNWTNPSYAYSDTDADASATKSSTTNPYQAWAGFAIPALGSGTFTLDGIEITVRAASTDPAGCSLGTSLAWASATTVTSGASNWTSVAHDVAIGSTAQVVYTVGGPADTWGRTWSSSELTSTNFKVRLQYLDPGAACIDGSTASVDAIRVKLYWHLTTSVSVPDANLAGPNGEVLTPRGFWGTMLSQGAIDINGDAYLPYYETQTSTTNPDYKPSGYYDYAVEMPAGSANGQVQIYDPVFCATNASGEFGTGDRWFDTNGTNRNAISSFFTIYDTQNTLYDLSDDVEVASSGTLFRRIQASDTDLNGPSGVATCTKGAVADPLDGRYWHNRWWTLTSTLDGGADGKIYRIRTATTDPTSATDQRTADGENSFAIWATASGGMPRVYGLGAMEAFAPLDGGTSAIFYMAQIAAVHAGKTLVITLWDPGDTSGLPATLRILLPSTTGYTEASLTWKSKKGTTNSGASACNNGTGSGTSITVTNASGTKLFNGCWLTIEVRIPATYTAPTPPSEPGPGWWKIKYTMGGSSSTTSTDVTTWQVSIRGNPVHLVLP
jgi:Flp pilus assembly protein TadG